MTVQVGSVLSPAGCLSFSFLFLIITRDHHRKSLGKDAFPAVQQPEKKLKGTDRICQLLTKNLDLQVGKLRERAGCDRSMINRVYKKWLEQN